MKKLITTCALLMFISSIYAITFTVDGIFYSTISSNTVLVARKTPEYTGSIIIPSTVDYSGVTYNVTMIGTQAFYDCDGLTSVSIPSSVTTIGNEAFEFCYGLNSVNIPNSVTSIGAQAFCWCSSLTSFDMPNSVTTIGDGAFTACLGLTSFNIPSSITSIGYILFSYCTGLTSVSIPNSVTTIERLAFSECTGLTSITIPSSVTSIGAEAFNDCSNLTSVTIPSSVTSIGEKAFFNTAWYGNQPDGMIYINSIAYVYKGTMPDYTSIELNAGTTKIAEYAFFSCSNLISVTIPGSVTSIGNYAFYNFEGLTSVTIPSSVSSIEHFAFRGCVNLSSIYAYPITPVDLTSSIFVFDAVNKSTCTLYVPAGSKEAYQAAPQWQEFNNIVEMSTAVPTINNTNIGLYLNPLDDAIYINGLKGSLRLFDMGGRLLLIKQVVEDKPVSIASLPRGIYIVKLISTEATVERKIIKE